MAVKSQHDDFGEKIGGAKKDLWKQRDVKHKAWWSQYNQKRTH